ncbi:uncharacterized protein RHIMIDRAFT_277922 [Rhizopus microsporus ATCC 52813]|uniref:Uncharacterized protein n=1 Tax=Rhizopus microsporus ATCC 52813 TaxID=1340429 RepID=A0A2G4SZ03_RHIZD|nr:uncharacterized protein RHIMIDRAFT_277922 [Rhizopus microsporus ATCC 52813]PHZ14011.1 hypothetical protein RHIMIDRAFT_277922 [Rhizopus microsporus ATCC 52813]
MSKLVLIVVMVMISSSFQHCTSLLKNCRSGDDCCSNLSCVTGICVPSRVAKAFSST